MSTTAFSLLVAVEPPVVSMQSTQLVHGHFPVGSMQPLNSAETSLVHLSRVTIYSLFIRVDAQVLPSSGAQRVQRMIRLVLLGS